MRLIKKNTPPSSFSKYLKEELNPDFNKNTCPKKDLRKALFDEQFGVCAYCQRKLPAENGQPKSLKTKIEHHCEQTICNGENGTTDRRLDYSNLLLVCTGKNGQPFELHCDSKKAEINQKDTDLLPMHLNPLKSSHVNKMDYKSSGTITSKQEKHEKELNSILNINANFLKELRRKKWKKFFRESRNKRDAVNRIKMKRLLEIDLVQKNGKFTNDFPGLSEYMLKKFCS